MPGSGRHRGAIPLRGRTEMKKGVVVAIVVVIIVLVVVLATRGGDEDAGQAPAVQSSAEVPTAEERDEDQVAAGAEARREGQTAAEQARDEAMRRAGAK